LRSSREEHFDIVLLDISMPGMSGEEVLASCAADKFNGLRIIAYTAHALPEEKQSLWRPASTIC
jgi:CheY-like chemotaxis protein